MPGPKTQTENLTRRVYIFVDFQDGVFSGVADTLMQHQLARLWGLRGHCTNNISVVRVFLLTAMGHLIIDIKI